MATQASSISLTVDGTAVLAHAVSVRLAIDEPFWVDVELDDDKAAVPAKLVGAEFVLTVRSQVGDSLELTGLVAEANRTIERGSPRTDLSLVPAAWVLDLGRDRRIFIDQSPADVVKKILGDASIACTAGSWGATKRPTISQRDESDLAFIERLLAEEGARYWFSPGSPTKLVIADGAASPDEVAGEALKVVAGQIGALGANVMDLRAIDQRVTTGVRLLTHHLDTPAVVLDAKAGKTTAERFDWRSDYADAAAGKTRAQHQLDGLAGDTVTLTGSTNSARLVPGKSFGITGAALSDLPAEWLCVSVEISVALDTPLRAQFRAVPASTHRRPRPRAMPPIGLERAKVVGPSGQEIHVDDKSNVTARRWWDRVGSEDQKSSGPVPVGQWFLAQSMAYPRVGWDVALAHVSGDPDRPFVVGMLHDGAHTPPYTPDSKSTISSLQTATSASDGTFTELVFDDKKGQEELRLHTAKDLDIEIGDGRTGLFGGVDKTDIEKDRSVKIGKDRKLSITEDLSVEIDGKESITHSGSRSDTVKGKEDRTTKGDRTTTITKASTLDVGGASTLKVTGKVAAKATGDMQRTIHGASKSTIAAAVTLQADEGYERLVGGKLQETVAGATTTQGKGLTYIVKGDAQETIGAAVALIAKDVVESAQGKFTIKVGGAMAVTAPTIEIVADSQIEIVVGGAKLVISSSGIEIDAPMIAGAAPIIAEAGAQVKHNP